VHKSAKDEIVPPLTYDELVELVLKRNSEIERLRALFRHIVDNEPEGDVPAWIGKVARRGLMVHD